MSAEMCECGRNRIFSGSPFCNECISEFQTPKEIEVDYNDDGEQEYRCPTCGAIIKTEHTAECIGCYQKLKW